jgi:5-methylcytosine-specific restriction enzyme subunit McrC
VPVRNLWLLMLYASDLTRVSDVFKALIDKDIDELPDLVATLLATAVEHRLHRNLTRGYRHFETVLKRVRGRVDLLATEAGQLSSKGEVFCRFEDLTIDTPRNRLVRAGLDLSARFVREDRLARRCRSLSTSLARAGVTGVRPSRAETALDQVGRNDSADRSMITLARLVFDLALPTEEPGPSPLYAPPREESWVRRLFEKAVLGFARVELEPFGWSVRGGVHLNWQVSDSSHGLDGILPGMITDIVLDPPCGGRRVIIDTKFSSIITNGRFGDPTLKSQYLYQMYAYVRSQEGRDPMWSECDGLFLHPATNGTFHERVVIQHHSISFSTVDLSRSAASIRSQLRTILCGEVEAMAGSKEIRGPSHLGPPGIS